jgi:hypothetical protein
MILIIFHEHSANSANDYAGIRGRGFVVFLPWALLLPDNMQIAICFG